MPDRSAKMVGVRNTDVPIGVHPYMYDPPYAVWSVWRNCGWLYRIVLVLIGGLTVYSFLLFVVTCARLRSISAAKADLSLDLAKNSVQALHKHWVNVRHATGAVFCIFGLVLFLALQNAVIIFGDVGPSSAAQQILNNYTLAWTFGANAFIGFLVVQTVQWIVSDRISASLEEFDRRKNG